MAARSSKKSSNVLTIAPADIPAGVPMLRNSERKDFKRCPWRWWMVWREGTRPNEELLGMSKALWFGTGIHLALAEWYCGPGIKRGVHPAETWEAWVGDEVRKMKMNYGTEHEEIVDMKSLGIAMLTAYIDKYGRDEHWEVIIPEQTFAIAIPGLTGTKPIIINVGTFDLVYRDLADYDSLKLGEHKTAKSIGLAHLSIDDQAGTYWLAATDALRSQGLIGPNEVLNEITYNFLRKAKPDARPQNNAGMYLNKDGSVSKVQPPPLFHREPVHRTRRERATQLERIRNEATWMNEIRAGRLPLFKTPTHDCSWDCSLFEMCELHENGSDWKEFREAMFIVQDPYADHRKSAAE